MDPRIAVPTPLYRLAPLVATVLLSWRSLPAQAPSAASGSPRTPVFQPLLADPKEPQFFAAYLLAHSERLASRLGSVGFGQTIDLVGARDWQLAVAAGVFSQFNMQSATTDLMNTDYLIGFPVTYRRGAVATRFQLYHQSSHLGDGYILRTHAQRVAYSFEAAEVLASDDLGHWRLYGGGEYIFTHAPDDLKPGILHGGVEYRQRAAPLHVGSLAAGRFVAALDGRSVQDAGWQVGWSLATGVEFGDPGAAPGAGWRWSVLLKAYTGPSPYGQFYRDHVSSLGFGLGFAL
jgi:hypothetical protein